MDLDGAVESIVQAARPTSIFLYGSRARQDFLARSDYEVGVLMRRAAYIHRADLQARVKASHLNVYPFELESFLRGNVDTPFQRRIYLRELVLSAKTIRGRQVVETMAAPPIGTLDLVQEVRFNLGRAFAAVMSYRGGDKKTALWQFSKSCLFATRALEIFALSAFPVAYDDISRTARRLSLGRYAALVRSAMAVRHGEAVQTADLFLNISYMNDFIEPKLLKSMGRAGNRVLLRSIAAKSKR